MSSFSYPATKTLSENVITAAGALPVSCRVENGKIVPALAAVEELGKSPTNISMTAYSKAVNIFFAWADGMAYISPTGAHYLETFEMESELPFVFERREEGGFKAYLAGIDFCVTHNGKQMSSYIFDMPVYGGVSRYGRIFGIDHADAYKLRWSGDGGAFDWQEGITGAGWVNLDASWGKILNLVNYSDKLCAVRERGISVISAYGTPENFTVKYTDAPTPDIYKSTAAVAGGKLIFCTANGLYSFNGSAAEKIYDELCDDIISPTYAISLGDEYFLCGESKSLGRGAVLVYNAKSGSAYLVDINACALASNGKVFAYADGKSCSLQPGKGFSFTSGSLFFSGKRKVLKSIEIDCDGEVEIEVSNGVKSRIFGGQFTKIQPKICGKAFKITVRGASEVRALKAYAEVVDEV